ncbi:DgyrCDS3291 [Dimorphilus gyrociliatus]|uniref:DgyrCDS3291 n=1 Tax=Dimorphilus gyrociliatus TaxID=2664684 RepID=A0A7I8VEP0_9ANNE|nr:DgyrCDS3291 [Dimorphilus gyrociliatus]
MQKVPLKQVVLLGSTSLVILLHILSLALPYWTKTPYLYSGLFRVCTTVSSVSVCGDVEYKKDAIRAVIAFMFIGLIVLIAVLGLIIAFLTLLSSQSEQRKKIGLAISYGVAAICTMIAFAIYAGQLSGKNLHASFGLCVTNFILLLGLSGVSLVEF